MTDFCAPTFLKPVFVHKQGVDYAVDECSCLFSWLQHVQAL